MRTDFDQAWDIAMAEILSGMKEWRLQHPRATLREMEEEADKRWARVRARMIEDMAMASAAAGREEVGICPECGQPGEVRGGSPKRDLLTRGGQKIELERQHWVCPACGAGFFPSG